MHKICLEGNTALLLLASSLPERRLLVNTIELLLLNNADLSDCNAESKTVLHLSFELMNFALTTIFYKLGAKVNAQSSQDTYLLECEENDPSEIAKFINDLIQHLKLQHLLADLPLEKDALFKVLEKNLDYNKVADYIDSNNPSITERSLKCIVEQIQDDDVVASLFRSLDAKLKTLLLSPSGTDHFIFKHRSINPEPVNEKLHHSGIQKRK